MKRLSEEEVSRAARRCGFKLVSPYEEYRNNQQGLLWACMKNPNHRHELPLGKLWRGCPDCRRADRDADRKAGEFQEVGERIEQRGDLLICGVGSYENQKSLMSFVCRKCGCEASQMAVKVKLGQEHGCDKQANAALAKRSASYTQLEAKLAGIGLILVTSLEEYGGVRSSVSVRAKGGGRVESASVLSLLRRCDRG